MTNTEAIDPRLMAKVTVDNAGCWIWQASLSRDGYGKAYDRNTKKQCPAHRLFWILVNGPVPDGLVMDHLCRVRHCVNPEHLEPVTAQENARRGLAGDLHPVTPPRPFCKNGHPYSPKNSRVTPGRRNPNVWACRRCTADRIAAAAKAKSRSCASAYLTEAADELDALYKVKGAVKDYENLSYQEGYLDALDAAEQLVRAASGRLMSGE